MVTSSHPLTFGFPRMHKEAGERRDFLPPLVAQIARMGSPVFVERGIGSKLGLSDDDYLSVSPGVLAVDNEEAFLQDVVMILRAPEGSYEKLRGGATLVSMLHFPTRPQRITLLRTLGLDGSIALDCITDDRGVRLVEDSRAVAWGGTQ